MEMKQYLIDSFRYNDYANKLALAKIFEMRNVSNAELGVRNAESNTDECIRFFSHLINSMNKWLARIRHTPGYIEMDWWLPVYELDALEAKWDECLKAWLLFLESKTEEELFEEVEWKNPPATAGGTNKTGGDWAAVLKDIALQLNYHSIHHRAQIQYLIRQQGIEPDFVDYIGTKYRKLS
jgi:uncharacterized damage-inducible protein DinB